MPPQILEIIQPFCHYIVNLRKTIKSNPIINNNEYVASRSPAHRLNNNASFIDQTEIRLSVDSLIEDLAGEK